MWKFIGFMANRMSTYRITTLRITYPSRSKHGKIPLTTVFGCGVMKYCPLSEYKLQLLDNAISFCSLVDFVVLKIFCGELCQGFHNFFWYLMCWTLRLVDAICNATVMMYVGAYSTMDFAPVSLIVPTLPGPN